VRMWGSSITSTLGCQLHKGDNDPQYLPNTFAGKKDMKKVIRLFFILTVALITAAILRSLI
jgi:hypothetical protein